jgi:O-antigen ligase
MLLGMVLVIVVVLPTLPDAFWSRMQTIQTYEEDEGSALSRLHFWAVASEMAKANPLLGVGYLGYNLSYDDYDFSYGEYGIKRSVHSAYFGVLSELGYLGAILFGLIVFCAFRSCHRVRRFVKTNAKPLAGEKYAAALEASLVTFLVGSLFLSFHSSEMFWHYVGLTIALERIVTEQNFETSTTKFSQPLQMATGLKEKKFAQVSRVHSR